MKLFKWASALQKELNALVLEGKEVGLVYIGIYIKGTTFVFENHFQGDRDSIRETSVKVGKEKLLQLLQ